ncbi:DUF2141 domain-containing protein [Porphyrobacter sp. YT40]|uniref:DUF2141 domain-containing protein n=1 Tax=Porphyrobacter sp. YT40 TaxID=2547601 RepID=UPI0011413FC1|nr:DUF2141 domain-containing protein [Porphyrobacter sp. YT40]QDH33349.1 DUF2141 domain-containing protein [Porphyrobacter sp. YT40]
MTNRLLSFRIPDWPALGAGLVIAGAMVAAPLAAQSYTYARSMPNDPGQCAAGKGPAVRVNVTGLKSSEGNLFVRAYPARSSDWLESKRYVMRVDARPQAGSVTVCVPLPATGDFAIAVHHDVNGNRKSDLSDGAGMSNNPGIRKILGLVPRPPSVEKVRFNAGQGVTRMTISVQYM